MAAPEDMVSIHNNWSVSVVHLEETALHIGRTVTQIHSKM